MQFHRLISASFLLKLMASYDTVLIKDPLPDGWEPNYRGFQTYELGGALEDYSIENGELYKEPYYDGDPRYIFPFNGHMILCNGQGTDFREYSYEFKAGQVVRAESIEPGSEVVVKLDFPRILNFDKVIPPNENLN